MSDDPGMTWEDFKKGLDALRASGIPMPFAESFAACNQTAVAAFNERWGSALKITCYACPVQLHGTLADGTWLYFRERHGDWEVCTGPTENDSVMGKSLASGGHEGVPGGMSMFQVLGEIDKVLMRREGTRNE